MIIAMYDGDQTMVFKRHPKSHPHGWAVDCEHFRKNNCVIRRFDCDDQLIVINTLESIRDICLAPVGTLCISYVTRLVNIMWDTIWKMGHVDSFTVSLHSPNLPAVKGRPKKTVILCKPGKFPSATWVHSSLQSTVKASNISRALVGKQLLDHSDVAEASPVGAAPTTSSLST